MKILAIGGCHTYGYGVPEGESFTERLAQTLRETGETVEVDFLAPVKMKKLARVLQNPTFSLDAYDLILLQLGHFELLNQESFWNYFREDEPVNPRLYGAFTETFDRQLRPQSVAHLRGGVLGRRFSKYLTPGSTRPNPREWAKRAVLRTLAPFHEIGRLRVVRGYLRQILQALAPVRERVLVLTPLPSMNPLINVLREQGGRVFTEECQRQNVCVLDVFATLEGQAHFFTADGIHLNELGHHLVALELGELLRAAERSDVPQS
jgi:hypothetical protein